MATYKKILGQSKPAATTVTTAYTVPVGKQCVISSLVMCNTSVSNDDFRIYIVPSAGSASVSNAFYYDLALTSKDTFIATVGITLNAGDTVQVYSTGGNVTFNIFGQEND